MWHSSCAEQWESINKVWWLPFSVTLRIDPFETIVDEITFAYLSQFHFNFIGNSTTETFILVLRWNHSRFYIHLLNVRFGFGVFGFDFDGISHRSHRIWWQIIYEMNKYGLVFFSCVCLYVFDGKKQNALQKHNQNHK